MPGLLAIFDKQGWLFMLWEQILRAQPGHINAMFAVASFSPGG
jgi:hypothetical protein